MAITLIGLRRLNLLERKLGRYCNLFEGKVDAKVYLGDWIDEVVGKIIKNKEHIYRVDSCWVEYNQDPSYSHVYGLDELKGVYRILLNNRISLMFYNGMLITYSMHMYEDSKEREQLLAPIIEHTLKVKPTHYTFQGSLRYKYCVDGISTIIDMSKVKATYRITDAIKTDKRLTKEEVDKLGISSIKRLDSPKERQLREKRAIKDFEELIGKLKKIKEEEDYNSDEAVKERWFKKLLAKKNSIEGSMLKTIEDNDLHVYVRWLEDAEACNWKSVYPGDKDNEDLAIIELETRKHPIVNVPEYKLAKEAVAMVNNMLREYYPVLKEARAYQKATRHKSYQLGYVDMRTGRGMHGFEFNRWKTDERTHQNNVKLLYLQDCAEAYYGQHGIAFNGYHATGPKSRKYLKQLRGE